MAVPALVTVALVLAVLFLGYAFFQVFSQAGFFTGTIPIAVAATMGVGVGLVAVTLWAAFSQAGWIGVGGAPAQSAKIYNSGGAQTSIDFGGPPPPRPVLARSQGAGPSARDNLILRARSAGTNNNFGTAGASSP